MKKRLLLLISILITLNAISRDVINMNNDWIFGKSLSSSIISKKVNIPHTWQRHETDPIFTAYRGGYQYLKEFSAPFSWQNKSVFIRFKGVASIANVFVNGKYVGEHRGAYTAFTFDLTPYLRFGTTNTILVNVDNSVQLDVMPLSGDFNVYGGIFRDVELIVTSKTHISTTHYSSDGVYVQQHKLTKELAELNVKVMLAGQYGDKVKTTVKLYDQERLVTEQSLNSIIPIDSDIEVDFPFTIENPHLWNGKKDPFLYRCVVEVSDIHDIIRDDISVNFGLRNIAINRQKGFYLNDESYPLYGVTYIQDKEELYSALTLMDCKEDMRMIKEIGATAIRTSNAPHSEYVYDLTDRNGIIAWVDLPFTGDDIDKSTSFLNSMEFMNNGKTQLEEMIYQNYNHPSIAFWGLFSNISGYGDNPIPYIKELNEMAHSISPNVLTVACSNEDGAINNITDAISWSQYLGWRTRKASDITIWLDSFRTSWNSLKPALGEYGAGGSIHQQSDVLTNVEEKNYRHPENYQTYFHINYMQSLKNRPYIWGYFVNSMFDYGSSHRFNGDNIGKSDLGLVTYNRHTKKDAFYLYKALWNKEKEFVYITERRITRRSGTKQTIQVFSSCRAVDLYINDKPHSTVTVINGIATWHGVILKPGVNKITAQWGEARDSIEIEVFSN